jgi:hypothetical protein
VRGSSSAGKRQKAVLARVPQRVDADEDVPVLDMPADSDWVLLGPYEFDRTFMHDALIYQVSRQIGRWASRTRFVEVFIIRPHRGTSITPGRALLAIAGSTCSRSGSRSIRTALTSRNWSQARFRNPRSQRVHIQDRSQ